MRLPAIDLNEDPLRWPAEVAFLAAGHDVDQRRGELGAADQVQEQLLGVRPGDGRRAVDVIEQRGERAAPRPAGAAGAQRCALTTRQQALDDRLVQRALELALA